MPTYEYECPDGHQFEKLQKMSDKPRATCPVCGKPAVRKISGGAGLVFKGSGFYITDYGKDGKKDQRAAPAAKDGSAPGNSESAAKSDSAAPPTSGSAEKATSEAKPAAASKPSETAAPKKAKDTE
jgi:putative FmdB family regulatory protein